MQAFYFNVDSFSRMLSMLDSKYFGLRLQLSAFKRPLQTCETVIPYQW